MESMDPEQSTGDVLYAKQVLGATGRAMECAAAVAHEDLQHGLNTLATLASLAPLLGFFGTLCGLLFDTFRSIGTERSTAMAAVADGISQACLPMAIGIVVGLQSLWCYKYFRGRLATFDLEMADIRLKLMNQLALHLGRVRAADPTKGVEHSLPYLDAYSPDLAADARYQRRCALATSALLVVAFSVQVVAHFEYDAMPISSMLWAGLRFVVFSFGCTCLLAYAVWVDLLHRKSTAVALIAAALCVSWSVAGLLLPEARF